MKGGRRPGAGDAHGDPAGDPASDPDPDAATPGSDPDPDAATPASDPDPDAATPASDPDPDGNPTGGAAAADDAETALFRALEDPTSRAILTAITDRPRSVTELTTMIDASSSTIYRRLSALAEHDLVSEGLELDRKGHHRTVYRTAFERVEVTLDAGEIDVQIEWREDAIDRFTRLWEDIRGER